MNPEISSCHPIEVTLAPFGPDDPAILRAFAEPIWREAYREIISEDQILYMLDRGYAAETIRNEIQNLGIEYLWIQKQKEEAGFLATEIRSDGQSTFVHKFYIDNKWQGAGIAAAAMDQLASRLRSRQVSQIQLRVNRNNERAIRFYKKCGFVVTGEDVLSIGGSFVMDDFLMQRSLH